MKKVINIFLAVLITLFSFPINGVSVNAEGNDYGDIKDGQYEIGVKALETNSDKESAADGFLISEAILKVNGDNITLETNYTKDFAMDYGINWTKIEGNNPISQDKNDKAFTYVFEINEVKEAYPASMNYYVPGMPGDMGDKEKGHSVDYRIVLDKDDLAKLPIIDDETEDSVPEKPGDNEQPEPAPEEREVGELISESDADEVYTVNFDSDSPATNGQLQNPTKLLVKGDKEYIQIPVNDRGAPLFRSLKFNGEEVTWNSITEGPYTIQYELVNGIEGTIDVSMVIQAGPNTMPHDNIKLWFDQDSLEVIKEAETPEQPEEEKPTEVKPFELGYTFYEPGTKKVSTMDNFKEGLANIVKNDSGSYDVEMSFTSGNMIEYFEIKGKKAKATLDGDIKRFTFTINNLTDIYKVKVKVSVPGLYDTEHDVDLVFDKIDLDNPVTEKVLELNKKHPVSAGETITIKGDNDTKLVLPSDLPSGVKLTITEVKNAKNLGELEKAGKVYSFVFEGLEGYNGTYELTMGVDKKYLANDYAASIYYHNQDKNQWEKIKSNVRNGKVTATLTHFSEYGVLADKAEVSKKNEKPKKEKTDKVKADKVSTIDYVVYQADKNEVSAADSFFKKPAILLEKDGETYLQFTITSWSMVNWLKANGKDVLVIAEDKGKDTATVQIKIDGDLSEYITLGMKITVPGLYEMEHDARLALDPSSVVELEGEEAAGYFIHTGVAKPGDFGTNGDKTDKKKQAGENGNPKTGDTSQIFFFTMLLIGSLGVLVVQLRRRLAA